METFTFSADGKFDNKTDNAVFEKEHYTCEEIATIYLPSMFGPTLSNKRLTYGMLLTITKMVNNGWNLLPSFYKTIGKKGTLLLRPSLNYFMLWHDNNGTVTQYICYIDFDCDTSEVELFNGSRRLAIYESVDAMFECMPQLLDTEPLVCVGYDDKFIENNVSKFDTLGFEDDIFKPQDCVYGDMEMDRCIFHLDMSKCVEIKDKKTE